MLLANEAAATFAKREKLPFVYRVHDKPASEKLEVLSKVFAALGVDTRGLLLVPDPRRSPEFWNRCGARMWR